MDKNQDIEKQLKSSSEYSQHLVQTWLEKYGAKNTNKELIEENIHTITAIKDTQGIGYTGQSGSKMNIKTFSKMKKDIIKNKKDSKTIEKDEESKTEQMIRALSTNRSESKSLEKKRKHK